jgi:hypothetical protein
VADGKRIIFLLELWPDGLAGQCMEKLWDFAVDDGAAHKIADHGWFDDAPQWKPDPAKGVNTAGPL